MNFKRIGDFIGKWRITEMELWDQEYIDFVKSGYFLFNDEGMGKFVFGTVTGFIDSRINDENEITKVEYSWEGTSEMDLVCGRGWFEIKEEGKMYGRLFIHNGDDSWIKVEKQ